jgi:hypothetical protein
MSAPPEGDLEIIPTALPIVGDASTAAGASEGSRAWFDRNQRERFSRTKETKMQVRLTVENEVVWSGSINGFFAANGIAADEANTITANLTEKGEHAFGGGAGPLFILSEAGDKFTYTAGDLEVAPIAIPSPQTYE